MGIELERGGLLCASRVAAVLFALAGVLFAVYPTIRPYAPDGGADGVAEFASGWWVVAHLSAVLGFLVFAVALAGLHALLRPGTGRRPALAAVLLTAAGVGLTLPYYGAETFALHALGGAALLGNLDGNLVLSLAEQIRMGGAQMILFGAGLLLLAAGAASAAVAIFRSGTMLRWSGIPAALGFALFIPQFYAGAGLRMAHGVLIGLGCCWIAAEVLRACRTGSPGTAAAQAVPQRSARAGS